MKLKLNNDEVLDVNILSFIKCHLIVQFWITITLLIIIFIIELVGL